MSSEKVRSAPAAVSLGTIGKEWLRLGCIGFGGPPTHIALLRRLCVEERQWIEAKEFEDAIATTNLLPGPASTQLAIYCAWRLRGAVGAVLGGLCFIVPGLVLILALSAVFLASHPPDWILGAAAGAGAAVPAVALHAAWGLVPASWNRIGTERGSAGPLGRLRRAAEVSPRPLSGPTWCLCWSPAGVTEIMIRRRGRPSSAGSAKAFIPAARPPRGDGRWSRGSGLGGVQGRRPLLRRWVRHRPVDAARRRHDLPLDDRRTVPQRRRPRSDHPGPGRANRSRGRLRGRRSRRWTVGGADRLQPHRSSSSLVGGRHFDRIRANKAVESFLTGAGPAVIGAIAGSAIPLGLAFGHLWQIPVLTGGLLWLFVARRGVVGALLVAGAIGVVVALSGVPA